MVPVSSIVFMVIALIVSIALPVGLALYFGLKKKADIIPFFVGCAVMVLFAFVLEQLVHYVVLKSPAGDRIQSDIMLSALYGGAMAGIFEETGRFAAFKTVLKKYRGKDINSLMYGAGHGGIEALILLGITSINNITYSVLINPGNTETLTSPASGDLLKQIETAIDQLITTPSYTFLLGGVERIFAVALQLSLSVLVWFAVKNAKKWYLYPLAIFLHFFVDACTVIISKHVSNLVLVEVFVGFVAVVYVIIAKLVWNDHISPVI